MPQGGADLQLPEVVADTSVLPGVANMVDLYGFMRLKDVECDLVI
jgi:hypothetical protein